MSHSLILCEHLRWLIESARECQVNVHPTGTYVCMEGPLFSTGRNHNAPQPGASAGEATLLPEAKLAREAEMCYAMLRGSDGLRLLAWRGCRDRHIMELISDQKRGKPQTNSKTAVLLKFLLTRQPLPLFHSTRQRSRSPGKRIS